MTDEQKQRLREWQKKYAWTGDGALQILIDSFLAEARADQKEKDANIIRKKVPCTCPNDNYCKKCDNDCLRRPTRDEIFKNILNQ